MNYYIEYLSDKVSENTNYSEKEITNYSEYLAEYVQNHFFGTQGVSGPQGISGTQGVSGPQGISGTQGVSGPQGIYGTSNSGITFVDYNLPLMLEDFKIIKFL